MVADRRLWEQAGLEWHDNATYMDDLLAHLNANVEAEMGRMKPEPSGITHKSWAVFIEKYRE